MKTDFTTLGRSLDLRRYPEHLQDPSWQAWDSADEYLITHVVSLDVAPEGKSLLIFNDDCGALACWFSDKNWTSIDWVSDSHVSRLCCQINLDKNEVGTDNIQFLNSLAEIQTRPDIVLIKIPKTTALLHHQLLQLQKIVSKDTIIIAAGKAKTIHKSTLTLFEKYLGETKTSLAKKKSRLIFTTPTGDKHNDSPYPTVWKADDLGLTLSNHANVFSRHQLDIGGRFFIQHLPNCKDKTVIDLGCGNGLVGLAVLKQNPDATVIFVDESYMAVASAQLNVEQNFPEKLAQCEFVVSNCLDECNAEVDIVLCNPPFHQSHGITDHIAVQMFKDAKRVLKQGGELRVIGNRHLGYHKHLMELFGNCDVVASNRKFSVMSAVK